MSNLEVHNLSKHFGRVRAVEAINLDIKDGEFMVLLGPTAAGKTTTLRCVAGVEKPDQGIIKMDGVDITQLSPAERDIAFVFQTYALYPRKSAYENMAFPLEARDLSKQAIDTRIREIADLLQITELLDRRPAAMSGGQQQRVALGRAMVRQPRMFLMDEPLTNLDFKLRVEMRAELKRLQRELDTTFFYVTNDQIEAMSMADRIAVLNEGVLQQIDTPEHIYNHPANLFVAQFVGNPRINTIPCNYENGTLHSVDGSLTVPLQAWQRDAMKGKTQNLILGIRSEDIALYASEQPHTMMASVYILEPLGDRTYVDVQIGKYTLKVRADADYHADSDDTVHIAFDIDRLHVFDADTGITVF
ncbi:MAG: ABC transporter ATP-binding protein [Chloroflexota bacterium]